MFIFPDTEFASNTGETDVKGCTRAVVGYSLNVLVFEVNLR